MKSIFQASKKYIKKYIGLVLLYGFLSILFGISSLITPYVSGMFIDNLIKENKTDFIYKYAYFYLAVILISILLGYIVNRIYVYIQTTMSFEFNRDVIKRLHHADLQSIQKYDSAYLAQRINNDCNSIISFSISIVQEWLINIIKFALPLIIVIKINYIFGVIVILTSMIYFIIYTFFKNILYKYNLRFLEAKSEYFSELNSQLKYEKFIRIHVLVSTFLKRLDNNFKEIFNVTMDMQKISYSFSSLDKIISSLMQIIVFIIGGISVINKQMTVGELTIIMSYFGFIISSGTYFFMTTQNIQKTTPCVNRINELYNMDINNEGQLNISQINNIKVENLSFKYKKSDTNIISDFNYEFNKGNIYLICGQNGGGKSTLLNIIIGLYRNAYSGNIYFNNINSRLLNLEALRKSSIAFCEQNPVFINDTISYNLKIFNSEFEKKTNDLLKEELKIHKEFRPDFNTIIHDDKENLSGGEKKLIALIRMFIKEADVLILDEPSSSLDNKKSNLLKKHLKKISHDKIIIIVSHESSYKDIADEIIKLN